MVNGRNEEYIVVFGDAQYHPESYVHSCRQRFLHIKDARYYARCFRHAYIFKVHYDKWGDVSNVKEMSR